MQIKADVSYTTQTMFGNEDRESWEKFPIVGGGRRLCPDVPNDAREMPASRPSAAAPTLPLRPGTGGPLDGRLSDTGTRKIRLRAPEARGQKVSEHSQLLRGSGISPGTLVTNHGDRTRTLGLRGFINCDATLQKRGHL